jgi:predicted nuclease of predicted toxin-antitoxin system
MKFLVEECTGPAVAHWLRLQGHEVFSVYEEARGLDDEAIIRKAYIEDWILITNDKEFGEKVYRERRPHRGLILLRLQLSLTDKSGTPFRDQSQRPASN